MYLRHKELEPGEEPDKKNQHSWCSVLLPHSYLRPPPLSFEKIKTYVKQGRSGEDATALVTTVLKDREFFVDVVTIEELHLQLLEGDGEFQRG